MVATVETPIIGHVQPRLYTKPLRELTPETSEGFAVISFAEEIGMPLDLWQQGLVVHAMELQADGKTPRFHKVLVLVARQNGKTHLLVILSLYWLYKRNVPLVLGTSTNLDTARESWEKAVTIIEDTPMLAGRLGRVMRANGKEELAIRGGGRYRMAASNRRGGRGLTVDRLIMDELREHHDWTAYSAAVPATSAVPDAQVWMITNAGDEESMVLNELRKQALADADERLGIFEWSGPDGSEATDIEALQAANPALGIRISLSSLQGDARRAELAGGDQLTSFLTEHQCRFVPRLNPAIDPDSWQACFDLGDLSAVRDRVTLCMDVSLDMRHASVFAAAELSDGRVRVERIEEWGGPFCTDSLRKALPDIMARVKPKMFGWFPSGPAASLAADMTVGRGWPPADVEVEEIRGDVNAVCMGFVEQVDVRRLAHSGDPLLDAHVMSAEKFAAGDGWRFSRKEGGQVDALYAAAGAVHLAREWARREPEIAGVHFVRRDW